MRESGSFWSFKVAGHFHLQCCPTSPIPEHWIMCRGVFGKGYFDLVYRRAGG